MSSREHHDRTLRPHSVLDWEHAVRELFEQVWSVTLGHGIRRHGARGEALAHGPLRRASVSIRGNWRGEVTLQCPEATAREFGAALFRRSPDALGEEELRSTLHELVNILGGNIKALLPGENELSLPNDGAGPRPALPRTQRRMYCELQLDFHGWPVTLTVEERLDE
ncbi:MAG: chemotaxis protein CheX [Planctomycetes bacterium]|nr:chemotaxis protein CheX [Planctomycetota bacterium]